MAFDPNAPAQPGSGIFGLPHTEAEALVVLLPVPWEATTSYGGGAAEGPRAILDASKQVDLHDLDVDRPWQHGIHLLPFPETVQTWNEEAKRAAAAIIEKGGAVFGDPELTARLGRVNELSDAVNAHVETSAARQLAAGKIVGVIGGDHSVPFGALRALAAHRKRPFGVLHFDAHSDTRAAYEGFAHSHASIMHNVLERIPEVERLVQVGIRDVCEAEIDYCRSQGDRVRIFFDRSITKRKHEGEPFVRIAQEIATALPDELWVSFDIDGLDPRYCPHTGTPVPGGLELAEAITILREVVRANKRIVGFDLNEVAPAGGEEDEWDGNVGARLLYKMIGMTLASQERAVLFE